MVKIRDISSQLDLFVAARLWLFSSELQFDSFITLSENEDVIANGRICLADL